VDERGSGLLEGIRLRRGVLGKRFKSSRCKESADNVQIRAGKVQRKMAKCSESTQVD